ncbi:hypothetical protein [Paraburkholderia kururiensis]|uniref:Uncharacterized protein n=1 Tax=Paraburkholderia kururiensis TaxID=984307 RepID=A0ABZ0WFC5_9BURK|nr:hypothetical protein [Paraburkholderia kururiensis]WQD76059.1 hypothetical protein U0042_18285 [Paraburkholderia kururiensis]
MRCGKAIKLKVHWFGGLSSKYMQRPALRPMKGRLSHRRTIKTNKVMATNPQAVSLNTNQLHPYAAFQLYECATAPLLNLRALAGGIAQELAASGPNSGHIVIVAQSALPHRVGTSGWAIHFKKTSQSAWTDDPTVVDVEQHVLLLISNGRVLGMSTSATEVRKRVNDYLDAQPGLTAMAADVLENALLRSSKLRTLWLSGIHRKSPFKADSKVLTGPQLETALNPLDDRTFRPSAGRADTGLPVASGVSRVGVSPKRSYAWIGPTTDVADFASRFQALVGHIANRRTKTLSPLPILSQALAQAPTAGSVVKAFDFSFISTDTAADLDNTTKSSLEEFEARVELATTGHPANQDFALYIRDRDHANANRAQQDWQVDVTVTLANTAVTAVLATDSQGWPRWNVFKQLLRNRSIWSVWYESGHSLGGGEWTILDARASSYEGTITPVNFSAGNWNIESEKPLPRGGGRAVVWAQIGADSSLFSWWIRDGMAQCFPHFNSATDPNSYAFCICDDGTNELADFIVLAKHRCFATPTNPSHLAFVMVHLKASSSSDPGRSMAPKQYEEVLGQATKNLGRVHFPETLEYLMGRLGRGVAMLWEWTASRFQVLLPRGTKLPKTAQVRTTLKDFNGQRHHFHVVVVQPHQGAGNFNASMNGSPVDFKTHMLCTLLCAAEGAARASSANLNVVMSP